MDYRSLFFLIGSIFSALNCQTSNDCWNFISDSRLDASSEVLNIDKLIKLYHEHKNWSWTATSHREYSIDVTCLQNLKHIQKSEFLGNSIQLTTFIPEVDNSSPARFLLKIIYMFPDLKSVDFTVRVHIPSLDAITSVTINYNYQMSEYPPNAFSLFSNLLSLNLAKNNLLFRQKKYLSPASFKGLARLTHLNLSG